MSLFLGLVLLFLSGAPIFPPVGKIAAIVAGVSMVIYVAVAALMTALNR
jgi:hypothetical protein